VLYGFLVSIGVKGTHKKEPKLMDLDCTKTNQQINKYKKREIRRRVGVDQWEGGEGCMGQVGQSCQALRCMTLGQRD
jgi:hypothetical protein